MNRVFLAAVASVFVVTQISAAAPTVTGVKVVKSNRRVLEMEYQLVDGPAIVMLSVTTNGVAVGEENLAAVSGDINTIVSGDGKHAFSWHLKDTPMAAFGRMFDSSVKLVCRPLENPPDYMIVNLAKSVSTPRYTFAETVDGLVGGLTNNSAYWTDKLVMRRIHARNIPWTMGYQPFSNGASGNVSELPHEVTLTGDYWAAVFQFTRGQWAATTARTCPGQYKFSDRRPVDSVRVERADTAAENIAPALRGDLTDDFRYPNPPHAASLLGLLRARTGLAFDLPGEAMWEYAAKAGTTDEQWSNGTVAKSANFPGRCADTGGLVDEQWPPPETTGVTNGTAEVGSYAANRFGLYDVQGNGNEFCLDWYEDDIRSLCGAINANGGKTLGGIDGTKIVSKGGNIGDGASCCHVTRRQASDISNGGRAEVFRVFIHSIDPRLVK